MTSNNASASNSTAAPQHQHLKAVATLVLCTVLWSSAGVITRQIEGTTGFAQTFWRSVFCFLFMVLALWWQKRQQAGWKAPMDALRQGGMPVFFAGICWCVMFTCFMVALTLTTVANTLITMAVAPLIASLLAWVVLKERISKITWVAMIACAVGIAWMVSDSLGVKQTNKPNQQHALGMLVAFGVPVAAAVNLILMKSVGRKRRLAGLVAIDFSPAVLWGAMLSCLAVAGAAAPLNGLPAKDLAWLAFLGVFQLGLPCMLMIGATRYLAPQETALLALLEVILGPLWVWLLMGEAPSATTLQGGALVLGALLTNELLNKTNST